MKFKEMISTAVASTVATARENSPEILVVSGIIGVIAASILACKATTKISEILDEAQETVDQIHDAVEDPSKDYTEEDSRKDLAIVYIQTGYKIAKLYLSAALVGTLSIVSILASNNILKRRNVALAAAYTAVDTGFKEYRRRVVEKFGDEVDKELRFGIKKKQIEETIVGDDGKTKKIKQEIDIASVDGTSDYARFFDESCAGWEKDPEQNLVFLRKQQAYINDILRTRKYVFLNEVYRALGIPESKAGQIVGWRYCPNDPNFKGDNYIDFGIYNIYREKSRDFVNGYERSILLDFNVDGPIIDYLESRKFVPF